MHLDVAEMTSHIQLIEAKFLELTSKLHSKDVEIADLEQNQKVSESLGRILCANSLVSKNLLIPALSIKS